MFQEYKDKIIVGVSYLFTILEDTRTYEDRYEATYDSFVNPGPGYCRRRVPVVSRGAQILRGYLTAAAAALTTVADWL